MSVAVTLTESPISLTLTGAVEQTVSIPSVSQISVSLGSVAAGIGVPSGGTTGQQLTKSSDTNYDTAWSDAQYPAGIDKTIQFNDGGTLAGDQLLKWDKTTHTLRVGVEGDTPLPNNPASFRGNVNSYLQVTVQNDSSSDSASTDLVVGADNGDDETYYCDVGINGSGYSADDITQANDSYLWANGGDLYITTDTSGKEIKMVVGGDQASNVVATFTENSLTMGTGKTITNHPEIFYGTGSPPSAVGKADGTLFFKYTE